MPNTERLTIQVSQDIGTISGILISPTEAKALLVLSHGAGANMEHPFMEQLAQELAQQQIATLRFNFAYMEKGKRAPDRPPKAHAVITAAVQAAQSAQRDLPIFVGGKSFGGRMSSQLAAAGGLPHAKGLIYFGFPLHAAGKPGTERAAHLADITIPQLFLQGTRDTLARLDLIQEVCAGLPNAKLVILEGGDHSFKTLKRSGITQEEMIGRLAEETARFVMAPLYSP